MMKIVVEAVKKYKRMSNCRNKSWKNSCSSIKRIIAVQMPYMLQYR